MYTQEQYSLMERFEHGARHEWWLNDEADKSLRYLADQGLAAPHMERGGDVWVLTEAGKQALAEYRRYCAEYIKREAEQQAREAQRLEERHEDHARDERHHRTQNKIAIANIIVSILCFVAGLLVEHWTGLIERIVP